MFLEKSYLKKIKAALLSLAAVLPILLFPSAAWAQTEREMLEEWKELLSKGSIDAAFSDKTDRAKARFLMGLMRLDAGEIEEARRDFYESIMNRPDFIPEETGFSPDILQIYGEIRARLIGSIYVSTEPESAFVYVDEELMGRTPVVLENILEGMRVVRIAGDRYVDEEKTVYIYANKRLYLHMELRHDDQVPPKIFHDAPEMGYESKALRMSAIIKDIYGIKTARLYFRIGGEDDFSVIPLRKVGKDTYEAVVSAQKAAVGTLQYYIEANDTNGNGASLMSAEKPFNINIVPLDMEPPSATPGSAQKIEAVNVIPYSEGIILSRKEENGEPGKEVKVDVGAKRGAKPKEILTVFRHTPVLKDPDTGEILETNLQEIAGRIRLTGVGPERSKGEIIRESEKGAIEAGLLVRSRPGKVRGLSAKSDKAKRIAISWHAGTEPEIAGYNIYRAESSDGEFVKIEITNGRTKTEVVDKGSYQQRLIDGKKYYYRVSAFNGDKVEGVTGDIIEASTQQDIDLYTSFKAASGVIKEIRFTWRKPRSKDIVSIILERSEKPDGPFVTAMTVENMKKTGAVYVGSNKLPVADGKEYYFRIAAMDNKDRRISASRPVMAATRAMPSPPGGLEVAATPVTNVTLGWNMHSDSGVKGYNIYRKDADATVDESEYEKIGTIIGRTITEFTDKGGDRGEKKGIEYGKKYFYAVTSFLREDFESELSDAVAAVTAEKPQTPSNIMATKHLPKSVSLSWDYPRNENIEAFEIYKSKGGKTYQMIKRIVSAGRIEFTDRGGSPGWMEDGKSYHYKMLAVSHAGVKSDFSPEVKGITRNLPSEIKNLSGSNGEARRTTLSWRPGVDDATGHYRIYQSLEPETGFEPIINVRGPRSFFNDLRLKDGTKYYYRVALVDEYGLEGEPSDTVFITTKHLPDAPTNLEAVPGFDTVELNWERPNTEDVERYNIYSKGFFRSSLVGESVTESFVVEGLESGQTATFYITAVDDTGLESKPSQTVLVTTLK